MQIVLSATVRAYVLVPAAFTLEAIQMDELLKRSSANKKSVASFLVDECAYVKMVSAP